ncbi:MAG TPA: hypothetical protein VG963_33605 [Polyangiaceae bacterium]|nr:hypothetical protein [Polyangiaceae bacterium]
MSNANQRDRLRPRSSPGRGEEQANEQEPGLELRAERDSELSASAGALLARVRQRRRNERAPDDLRQRALARALAEAQRPAVLAMPAPVLVPVAHPAARVFVRLSLAVALGLGLVLAVPAALRQLDQRVSPEPLATGDWQVSGPAGELLAKQSPLFRLPLLPLSDPPRELGPSLFAEQPFAQGSGSWQVRLWNDPTLQPEIPARVQFESGALCVPLAPGDRVLGGWPWPQDHTPAPIAGVKLQHGRAYRLSFRAWVQGPLPSQVLLGVGHEQFPFAAAAAARVQVSKSPEPFAMDFVAAHDDDAAGVAFLATNIASHADPTRLCLAELRLSER